MKLAGLAHSILKREGRAGKNFDWSVRSLDPSGLVRAVVTYTVSLSSPSIDGWIRAMYLQRYGGSG